MRILAVLMALAVPTPSAAADAPPGLAACRKGDEAFDARRMITACGEASSDLRLSVAERVEALRLLAVGLVLEHDEVAAEQAFLRMLVLDDTAAPRTDLGPRFIEVFERARARMLSEGALQTRMTTEEHPEEVRLRIEVADPLGRVEGARLTVRTGDVQQETTLSSNLEGAQRTSFIAVVHTPAGTRTSWIVEPWSHSGRPISVEPPLTGQRGGGDLAAGGAPGQTAALSPPDPLAWTLVGGGTAVALAGTGTAALWSYSLFNRVPCSTGSTDQCLPSCVHVAPFWTYCGAERIRFLNDATAAISGGLFLGLVGASLSASGVVWMMKSQEAPDAP